MSIARACERSLALLLVLTVASIGLPARGAPAPAAVRGKVLRSATGASLSGAVVRVALRPDARIFESGKADERGNYALGSLPPGTYDVAVQADGGLYVVNTPLALHPGEQRALSLSILAKADEPATPPSGEPNPPKPEEEKDKGKEKEKEKEKGGKASKAAAKGGFFHSPWGGAILVLGSAAVIGAVVSNSDKDHPASASPSE